LPVVRIFGTGYGIVTPGNVGGEEYANWRGEARLHVGGDLLNVEFHELQECDTNTELIGVGRRIATAGDESSSR
jgi:hypothetical protein